MPPLPPHSNPHVADLLGKLLAPDPKQRPTAEEAMLHPLFADVSDISDQIAQQHVAALFHASLAGTKPYPQQRIGFQVTNVDSVVNDALACKFKACRRNLELKGRVGAELAEQWAFVGCPRLR